ncbi:MAG: DUF5060 domain-containing protein [Cytophagales bacterium]|nr:DUF5060 domain-containing protein [Cytophagales bacterium]
MQIVYSTDVEQYTVFEVSYTGSQVANPFTDTQLSATFMYKNKRYTAEGFYDGNGIYKIRFMPDQLGEWTYNTSSNDKNLNGKTGTFICTKASKGNHGPVRVRDTFHFGYDDGTPFFPIGTTAYAWVWQGDTLVKQTLETLSKSPFNKIRMTIMPKNYDVFINTEPFCYPFEGSKQKGWDFYRPNPQYWQYFEDKVFQLMKLGIEADIILYHPYDNNKWGFDKANPEQNLFYLRYAIARLSAYRNVWWSLSNEYDIMGKPNEEWQKYGNTLLTLDPVQHLRSIHNGMAWYNHAEPWVTHLSIQTAFLQDIQKWRVTYQKPVVIDECVYEGNVATDWGNLTAEEMVNRFWITWCRGGYCTHGETYTHPKNILWWSKGGKLYGKSPERLAFMYKIMADAPTTGLTPLHTVWNKETYLYKDKDYVLYYIGNSQQSGARLYLSDKANYKVEIIDVWNMTITQAQGTFTGNVEVPLPGKPYIAVRAVKIK